MPKQTKGSTKGAKGAAAAEVQAAEAAEEPPASLGVLLTVIPVELVALYTAFIVGTSTRIAPTDSFLETYKTEHDGKAFPFTNTRDVAELRWIVYGGCVLAALGIVFFGWRSKRKQGEPRKVPIAEMFAGSAAFATWGLVMPDGLLSSYVRAEDLNMYTLGLSTLAAVLLLGLGLGTLKQKTKKTSPA